MGTLVSTIGWLATAFLLIAFGPQSYKVMKTKSAQGVSKITYPMVFFGSAMWAIYGSLGGLVQPLICNVAIIILMVPTVFYIFKENKLLMLSIIISGLAIGIASLIIFILVRVRVMDSVNIEWLSWIFISGAGAGTGLSYIPQMVKIIKTRVIGQVSVLTLTLVSLGNICWITFWILSYIFPQEGFSYTIILSIIWSVMGFAFQLPVIYLYIKQQQGMKN